jgi:hypothetical protein
MNDASRVQLQNALKTLSVNRTDDDAWRVLYDQTRTTVVDAAKRVLRDQAELVDDVAQEAFLRIFRYCKFADFPDADAFLRYLRTVAANAAPEGLGCGVGCGIRAGQRTGGDASLEGNA